MPEVEKSPLKFTGWGTMAQGEPEVEEEEPIQVDAGYDDDCCNEILQLFLHELPGSRHKELVDWLTGMDCETLLNTIGNVSGTPPEDISDSEKTLNDVYQECVAGKMPQGGDFTMGEPMDMAWRLLKHA